jgi:hypothetical protein
MSAWLLLALIAGPLALYTFIYHQVRRLSSPRTENS